MWKLNLKSRLVKSIQVSLVSALVTMVIAMGLDSRPDLQAQNRPASQWAFAGADDYVPVGATTFNVQSGHGYVAGDNIVIDRGSTQAWFEDIRTDTLEFPWQPGTRDLRFDRTITAVNGNQVTVDAPIVNALEQAAYGDMTVYKYTVPDRIDNVGIEKLRFFAETNGSPTDENHTWTAIALLAAEDTWVRQVDAKNFGYAAVDTECTAKAVTVEDVSYLEPISLVTAGQPARYSTISM